MESNSVSQKRSILLDAVLLLRPHQWVKNCFVFAGLVFGGQWADPSMLRLSLIAALSFCLASSSVYALNDIMDVEKDRLHPKKRHRPIAAGRISVPVAWSLAAVCAVCALGIGFFISPEGGLILLSYMILNTAYSFRLKHVVLLDVFTISAGFMLRTLMGTIGIGIPPSEWLLLCVFMLTLFLALCKRRAEAKVFEAEGGGEEKRRAVLDNYPLHLLDTLIGVCASCSIVTYGLYTIAPSTIELHQTTSLVYTLPFVVYGVFRYLYLLHRWNDGEDPSKLLIYDRHIIATSVVWVAVVLLMLEA